jgi:WD40 repeat protein
LEIEKLHTCTGHRAALYALARGRDARHVLSAGGDGLIVEWDLDQPETGKVIASVEVQLFSLCYLPASGWLVAGNMNGGVHWIHLEEPERSRNIQHHQKGVYDIVAVNGFVYTLGGGGSLTRWSAETAQPLESVKLSAQPLRALAYAPGRGELAVGASDHSISLVDEKTLEVRLTLAHAHGNSVFTVAYTPDERYLISGGRDAMLRVWDLQRNGAPVSAQPAHWFTINHIAFSPDGAWFATASRDKTVKIWSTDGFRLLKVIDVLRYGAHIHSVNRLLWLPDCLVSCSDDRSMMLWRVTEKEREGVRTS